MKNIVKNAIALVEHNALSSIMIGRGTYEPWCHMQHGRYNGSCLDGPVGLGNWAILIR